MKMKVTKAQQAAQDRIAKKMAGVGFALPGSLTVRAYRCGKTNCRCRAEPPQLHGPYAFWTRKINNKTTTRMLNDEQLAEYQPLFDNAKELRSLMNELQELTLQTVETADPPRSQRTPTKAPAPTPDHNKTTRRTSLKGTNAS